MEPNFQTQLLSLDNSLTSEELSLLAADCFQLEPIVDFTYPTEKCETGPGDEWLSGLTSSVSSLPGSEVASGSMTPINEVFCGLSNPVNGGALEEQLANAFGSTNAGRVTGTDYETPCVGFEETRETVEASRDMNRDLTLKGRPRKSNAGRKPVVRSAGEIALMKQAERDRNREAARASRRRKSEQWKVIQRENERLKAENERLCSRVASLEKLLGGDTRSMGIEGCQELPQ